MTVIFTFRVNRFCLCFPSLIFGRDYWTEDVNFAHSLVYLPLLVLVNMAIFYGLVSDLFQLFLSRETVFLVQEGVELFH